MDTTYSPGSKLVADVTDAWFPETLNALFRYAESVLNDSLFVVESEDDSLAVQAFNAFLNGNVCEDGCEDETNPIGIYPESLAFAGVTLEEVATLWDTPLSLAVDIVLSCNDRAELLTLSRLHFQENGA